MKPLGIIALISLLSVPCGECVVLLQVSELFVQASVFFYVEFCFSSSVLGVHRRKYLLWQMCTIVTIMKSQSYSDWDTSRRPSAPVHPGRKDLLTKLRELTSLRRRKNASDKIGVTCTCPKEMYLMLLLVATVVIYLLCPSEGMVYILPHFHDIFN